MNIKSLYLIIFALIIWNLKADGEENYARLSNTWFEFQFNLNTGKYQVLDKRDNKLCLQNAAFQINNDVSTQGYTFSFSTQQVIDELGSGKKIVIIGKKAAQPSLILEISIYPDKSYLVLNTGIANTTGKSLRIMDFSPLMGEAYKGFKFDDYKTLDGENGAFLTSVSTTDTLKCFNNLLATFGGRGKNKRSLVAGGLTYNEFQKRVSVIKNDGLLQLEMRGFDPVGKLVDAGSTYILKDKFYLDFETDNRFEALEKYGHTLAKANHTDVKGVNFPILNFWYAFITKFGGDEFRDNSLGTISEMEEIAKSGFLKYSPIGLRLEPDDYALPSNEQGWWDDKHWQMYKGGQLLKPYETIVKWGNKIKDMGGVPFIYCQTAKRSADYCMEHPEQMLFNDPFSKRSKGRVGWWGRGGDTTAIYWTYDFTDAGFIKHMKDVYQNLKNGGVRGIKFDYPETGWAYDGGFDDKYATTTSAYRNIFKLAYEGLGPSRDVQERIPPYGDVALGTVTTQRTEGDNDRVYPGRVSKTGLRWYKNRTVVNYDCDPINPYHIYPSGTEDGWRAAITMTYTTSGRMEIGKYFEKMTRDMIFDVSRAVPLLAAPAESPRPVDAFTGKLYPQVYDYAIKPDWHIVTFYNYNIKDQQWPTDVMEYWYEGKQFNPKEMTPATIHVPMGAKSDDGGLALDHNKQYYVFDFWNWKFVGKISGDGDLQQQMRPGEARVMAVHAVSNVPQFISTSRHLYQGYLDMVKYPSWSTADHRLKAVSKVIAGEVYKVIIATNGYQLTQSYAVNAECSTKVVDQAQGIYELDIKSPRTTDVSWSIAFDKK